MRNPKRIPVVLRALKKYWLANPDLRLAQIIVNANFGNDPFYMEDELFIERLMEKDKNQ